MEQRIKQRITGAIILLAILAIFLPILFHNSRPERDSDTNVANNNPVVVQLPNQSVTANNNSTPAAVNVNSQNQSVIYSPQNQAIPQTQMTEKQVANSSAPVGASASSSPAQIQPAQISTQAPTMLKAASSVAQTQPQAQSQAQTQASATALQSSSTQAQVQNQNQNQTQTTAPVSPPPAQTQVLNSAQSTATSANSWVLQLGSFSSYDNAARLVQKLQQKNYHAYLVTSKNKHGSLTRVMVGPINQLQSAKKIQTQIAAQFHVNGMVHKETKET